MNNGINYLSTGAGFLPSTISLQEALLMGHSSAPLAFDLRQASGEFELGALYLFAGKWR